MFHPDKRPAAGGEAKAADQSHSLLAGWRDCWTLIIRNPQRNKIVIAGLPKIDLPSWLEALLADPRRIKDPLPIEQLAAGALYYPASALDGTPVKYFGSHVASFIFVDYSITRQEYLQAVRATGFLGYTCVATREVTIDEIAPPTWSPPQPAAKDGSLNMLRAMESAASMDLFGYFSIWKRKPDYSSKHGPEGFSFLFLRAEGCAAYSGIFCHRRHNTAPLILWISQPGHSLGNNWTNFEDPHGFFHTVVGNSALPTFLLYGGDGLPAWYRTSCWPEYSELVAWVVRSRHRSLALWARSLPGRKHVVGTENL